MIKQARIPALAILMLVMASGCGGKPLPAPFHTPLESRLILQVPYFSDPRGAGGLAALAAVMTYGGHPITVEEIILHLGENPPSPRSMVILARQLGGHEAQYFPGSPEQLLEAVRQHQPLIVRLGLPLPLTSLKAGDYAVVVGYTPEGPVLNSGPINQQIFPWGNFLTAWYQDNNLTIVIK